MPRRPKPLSLKDTLVLALIARERPGRPLDEARLAQRLYEQLRTPMPQHWRKTMLTTLNRLTARPDAPLVRTGGGKGAGNRSTWRRISRKAAAR